MRGAVRDPGVHPDGREQVWVGCGHDRGHRATGGEPSDVDASWVDGKLRVTSRVIPAMIAGSPASARWSARENQFQ